MSEIVKIVQHPRRENHVQIYFQGKAVADGFKCPSGRIEVRPDAKHFSPLHRTHKVLDICQIEELVRLSDEWTKS